MPKIKTDEQLRSLYAPKIKAFTDERLNGENAKRIYDFLRPYHYDTDGRRLYEAAKGLLQADIYDEVSTEETKYLDILDGYGLLKYLEQIKFDDAESPEYREYQDKLYVAAIRSITISLVDKQPYLLDGFWNRLSYIENILEKGFPTRRELNEKIDREAKAAVRAASEDELTSFHSAAEIKCKIRDELYDISMTDETVYALYIKDDVLSDAYRFYTEESKDNQVHLAVFEYLEKVEHDYLAERVFDRAKLEYEDYIDRVKEMPPQKIIDEAYKITILYDLHISLEPETSDFNTERLRALYSLDSPLWSLYNEWQRRDWTHMDDIKDVIYDVADEKTAEIENGKCEIDPDPFGLDDQEDEDELEDGQEP